MSKHSLSQPWYRRILTLEPTLVRAVVTALVLAAAIWGVDIADVSDRVAQTFELLYPVIVLVGAWWTRSAVTPAVQVVQSVEPDGSVIAGPASALPTGMVIKTPSEARASGGVIVNPALQTWTLDVGEKITPMRPGMFTGSETSSTGGPAPFKADHEDPDLG